MVSAKIGDQMYSPKVRKWDYTALQQKGWQRNHSSKTGIKLKSSNNAHKYDMYRNLCRWIDTLFRRHPLIHHAQTPIKSFCEVEERKKGIMSARSKKLQPY